MRPAPRWIALAASLVAAAAGLAAAPAAGQQRAPVRDPDHVSARQVRSWKELRRQNLVVQRRDFSCGAAALATLLRYYWGDPVGEIDILKALDGLLTPEEVKDRVAKGLAISDLRRAAVKCGYLASIGSLSFEALTGSRVPLIVAISPEGYDHFVVYRGAVDKWVYLADPIRGNIRVTVTEFVGQWKGNAILAVVKPGMNPPRQSALSVRPDEVYLGELNDHVARTRMHQPYMAPSR